MNQATLRPLLVTGAHRSGTTWVGRMLAAGPGIAYISEPLNALHRPGVLRATVKHWYTYVCADNEAEFLPGFEELIEFDYHLWDAIRSLRSGRDLLRMLRDFGIFYRGSLRGQRPLFKDPFAVFSLPWFAERLGCQIVVTVRHPAAFASSLKRLNWSFNFDDLVQQRLLMRDYLEPYRSQMVSVQAGDVVGQAGLLWALIYRVVRVVHDRNPAIQIVLHERLSADPAEEFRKLYDNLGLNYTAGARDSIMRSSSDRNPAELSKRNVHSVQLDSRANLDNWKRRLTPEEIVHIRKLTEDVAHSYYAEESWN
jgi:hypothetical protein